MQGASRAGGVQRDPPEQPRGGAAVDRRGAGHARAGKGEEKTVMNILQKYTHYGLKETP